MVIAAECNNVLFSHLFIFKKLRCVKNCQWMNEWIWIDLSSRLVYQNSHRIQQKSTTVSQKIFICLLMHMLFAMHFAFLQLWVCLDNMCVVGSMLWFASYSFSLYFDAPPYVFPIVWYVQANRKKPICNEQVITTNYRMFSWSCFCFFLNKLKFNVEMIEFQGKLI